MMGAAGMSSWWRAVILIALMWGWSAAASASDDGTLDVAPTRATVPTAAADIDGAGVLFKPVESGAVNHLNSDLPVAADEGLWRKSKGLPIGTRIRLHVSDAKLPADGHSAVQLLLSLMDQKGDPIRTATKVRIETSIGRLHAPTGKEAASFDVVVTKGVARVDLVSPVVPGTALIRVSSGAVRVQGRISFVPALRPLIAVGIVEAGVSSERVSEGPNEPAVSNINFEDSLQHWGSDPASSGTFWGAEGRAAGFVKGTILGDVLLTGSFDTNKVNQQQFFSDVNPNQFYPISGDASIINYDARSTSKLYLRLDQGQSHILYGDFQTVDKTDTPWLGSYARTLTGLTVHYETEMAKVNVFGAMESAHQFIDEQPGRGISGPYAVSQADAVANSEIVQILTRDRNQPAVVLSSQTLTRYVDYDFEPFSGRIVFTAPVPSVDANLNPVSIRITYEVDNGGPRYLVDGANGEFVVAQGFSVGARYSQDHDPLEPFKLMGADSVWRISDHDTITVDTARSEGNQLYAQTTTGTLTAVSTLAGLTSADPTGNAGRVEWVHHDDDLDARVYAGKADLTFANANASLSPGQTEAGLHATYKVSESTQVVADVQHTDDETTEAHRSGATVTVETKLWSGAKIQTGLAFVDQTYNAALPAVAEYAVGAVPGTTAGASLNNTGFGFTGTGLLGSPLGGALALPTSGAADIIDQDYIAGQVKITQKVTTNSSVYAEYEHTLDGVSGDLAALGAEYRVDQASRYYVTEEQIDSMTGIYGLGDGTKVTQTVAGFDTSYMHDGTVYNELRLAGAESGESAAEALGVRNLWHVLPGLNATTAVERQEVFNPQAMAASSATSSIMPLESATSVALGLEYVGSPVWKAAERIEYRFSDVQNDWLSTLTVTRKLSADWSLIGRNVYLSTQTLDPGSPTISINQDRAQVGVAYRDNDTNRWNWLARYEYLTSNDNTPITGSDNRSQIVAAIGDYHPVRAWEFQEQLAAKDVNQILQGVVTDYTAELLASRVTWDFDAHWDIGLLGSTTTGGGSRDQGIALELGRSVLDNLWLSVGAIAGRYADTELFSANSSWRGVYVRMRFKFDEKTFGLTDPAINRSLDAAASTERQ